MKKNNTSARIQDLFPSYHKTLNRNCLQSIITDNKEVAVQYVLYAIKPANHRKIID